MGNSYVLCLQLFLCTHTLSPLQQPPSNQRMRDTSCSNVPPRATPPHCRICLPVPRFPVRPKVQMSISGRILAVWLAANAPARAPPLAKNYVFTDKASKLLIRVATHLPIRDGFSGQTIYKLATVRTNYTCVSVCRFYPAAKLLRECDGPLLT